MPEAVLRAGIDPENPDEVICAVVIDPRGSVGERAVAAVGDYCYPDERVAYVLQTDAFTERTLDNGVLTVDFMVFPSPAIADGRVDPADFPERSALEPLAMRVLRVTGTTTHDELPEETMVFLEPLEALAHLEDEEDYCPLSFPPPPEGGASPG